MTAYPTSAVSLSPTVANPEMYALFNKVDALVKGSDFMPTGMYFDFDLFFSDMLFSRFKCYLKLSLNLLDRRNVRFQMHPCVCPCEQGGEEHLTTYFERA